MNAYQRIRAAVSHQTPDRVPCDFSADPQVIARLCAALGLSTETELLDVLEIDRRTVGPRYVGPALQRFPDGSYEAIVSGGPIMSDIPADDGTVIPTTVRFPWAGVKTAADLAGLTGWSGKMEWWDFSTFPAQIDALEARGPYWISAHGDPSGLQHLEMWVGDERFLLLLAEDPDLVMAMIEVHNRNRLEHALKTLEAGGGRIHELNGGGDYGTQNNLLISRGMFRRYFKDLYLRFYREIKRNFDVEIFFHSCGAVDALIPDLIEMGVTILNPIQVRAHGMEIASLKDRFGAALTFHGGIDIQHTLPFCTPEEVRREVRRTIDILGRDGGYILAPAHAIQPDAPLENIIAMYEEAQNRRIL